MRSLFEEKGKGEGLKMIFNVPGHIDMIRNGLLVHGAALEIWQGKIIVKTQTRRVKRGYYQVEADRKKPHKIGYAVQLKRGAKGEPDIRIVMDRIWEEERRLTHLGLRMLITPQDAWAEGGYTVQEYEKLFRELNPKWDGLIRWAFEFHVEKC